MNATQGCILLTEDGLPLGTVTKVSKVGISLVTSKNDRMEVPTAQLSNYTLLPPVDAYWQEVTAAAETQSSNSWTLGRLYSLRAQYGKTDADFESVGLAAITLSNYASVYTSYHPAGKDETRKGLSFAHHSAVMNKTDRTDLLFRAEAGKLSVKALRELAKDAAQTAATGAGTKNRGRAARPGGNSAGRATGTSGAGNAGATGNAAGSSRPNADTADTADTTADKPAGEGADANRPQNTPMTQGYFLLNEVRVKRLIAHFGPNRDALTDKIGAAVDIYLDAIDKRNADALAKASGKPTPMVPAPRTNGKPERTAAEIATAGRFAKLETA